MLTSGEPTSVVTTVAGFVLAKMQHLPNVGESIEVGNWKFEVIDLDSRRIDKVLASRTKSTRRKT